MKTETITVKFDKVKLVKATSRNTFQGSVPRPKRIGDKRKRQPKYRPNLRAEE
jgi:hypothetical protein